MNPTEKLQYIDSIAEALSGFPIDRLEYIFQHYGYYLDERKFDLVSASSYELAYNTLKGFREESLLGIAKEFKVEVNTISISPSKIWQAYHFKIFISHSSEEKKLAKEIKEAMLSFGISGLVAHDDIHVTTEWRSELIKGLSSMDGFIAILTNNFKKSEWTDQEYGYALVKGAVFIPLILEVNPYGFMSATQGISIEGLSPNEIANTISKIIASKASTRDQYINKLFDLVLSSRDKKNFKNYLNSIAKLKNEIGKDNIRFLRRKVIEDEFFNHGDYIMAFNDFIKASYNELEFISKAIFQKHKSLNEDDDSLPF